VPLLQTAGHDAVHVGDVSLGEASDALILDRARGEDRIAVTLDADFQALMAVTGASKPSVIRFRIEGLRSAELASWLTHLLQTFETELERGALVTVQPTRIRVRNLPIAPRK